MSLCTTTISLRTTPIEKQAFAAVARLRGQSLSEFILQATRGKSVHDIEQWRYSIKANLAGAEKIVRRRKPPREPAPFRVPYLPRRHAKTFEEVVAAVAQRMNTDDHSVAILMTYLAEEIAKVVASGRVFRWPAFFAVGPYLAGGADGQHCRPRLQANPPFKNHILWSCSAAQACNREMDAHRRRRRRDRTAGIVSALFLMRHAIARQDLRKLEFFESRWREDSPVHFA